MERIRSERFIRNYRLLRIDEGKEHGTDDEHSRNHIEGQVVVS